PTTMIPLIALVTLISGVWSAGVTDQMICQPTITAITNTVRCCSSFAVSTPTVACGLPKRSANHAPAATRPTSVSTMPALRVGIVAGKPCGPCASESFGSDVDELGGGAVFTSAFGGGA